MEPQNNREQPVLHNILLTGATGYIGGRLLHFLENSNARVRCLVRNPENLKSKIKKLTAVVKGDVSDATTLKEALTGVDVAFYSPAYG